MQWQSTQGFVLNGLKREELIATNSMLLHNEPEALRPTLAPERPIVAYCMFGYWYLVTWPEGLPHSELSESRRSH